MSTDWGYNESNGPATWANKFPEASGVRQSPVDICTARALNDASLASRPLTWQYPKGAHKVLNTGHGWKAVVDHTGSKLEGGPLEDTYSIAQFHCHWGCSEHTVDGASFAGELHLVHWNSSKYESFSEAANKPDGLAVLGVFLQEAEPHAELQKIVDVIPKINLKGEEIELSDPVDPRKLLPEDLQYWTYEGSLTTPPCTESVTWIVFKQPIKVSLAQLSAFRSMRWVGPEEEKCLCEKTMLVSNYRPPLPLGERQLRECGSF